MIFHHLLVILIAYLIESSSLSSFTRIDSTSVLAIATVVLALATIGLAYFTYMLYQETKKMRLAQIQPDVEIYVSPEKQWMNLIDLAIKNIGPGTASNIRFSVNSEFYIGRLDLKKRLADLPMIRNGIDYMSPNQEYKFFLFFINDYQDQPLPTLDISISFKNAFGEDYTKNYYFDFSIFKDLRIEPDDIHKISESLENINRILARG